MASAQFQIQVDGGGYGTAGVEATASSGSAIDCRLASVEGVTSVTWSFHGTHDASASEPTITLSGTPNGQIASFTLPAGTGQAYGITCKINGGAEASENAAWTSKSAVRVAYTNGNTPVFINETFEASSTHATVPKFNDLLQATSSASDHFDVVAGKAPDLYVHADDYTGGAEWPARVGPDMVKGGNPTAGTGWDGLATVNFDGTGDYFSADTMATAHAADIKLPFVALMSLDLVEDAVNAQALFGWGNGATNDGWKTIRTDTTGNELRYEVEDDAGSSIQAYAAAADPPTGRFNVLAVHTGTQIAIYSLSSSGFLTELALTNDTTTGSHAGLTKFALGRIPRSSSLLDAEMNVRMFLLWNNHSVSAEVAEALLLHANRRGAHVDVPSGGVTDHGALTGLTPDDDHTQYALLAGRAGGQTLYGGDAANDDLNLVATSHGTTGTAFVTINSRFTSQETGSALDNEFFGSVQLDLWTAFFPQATTQPTYSGTYNKVWAGKLGQLFRYAASAEVEGL